MIHPRRALVRRNRVKRRAQRGFGVELVDQTIPSASCDPLVRGSPASVPSKPSVRPMSAQAPPCSARPLRHVYPAACGSGTDAGGRIRQSRASRLHLPTPLRSTGITRLHRYYECSDSCAWSACGLLDLRTSPATPRRSLHFTRSAFQALRLQPPRRSRHRFLTCRQRRWASRSHGSGLRHSIAGSPVGAAESSSCRLRIARSPRVAPHAASRSAQLPRLQAGNRYLLKVDLHLPDRTRLWTHDGRVKPGHDEGGSLRAAREQQGPWY